MLLPIRWPAANAAKHYLLAVALRIAKLVIYILTTDPVQWVWEHSSTPCNNFVGFLEIIALPLILSIYLSLVFPLFVFILLCGNNVINRKNQTNVSNEMITNLAQYNMHLPQFKPLQTYCLASEHLIWTINYPHTHKKKKKHPYVAIHPLSTEAFEIQRNAWISREFCSRRFFSRHFLWHSISLVCLFAFCSLTFRHSDTRKLWLFCELTKVVTRSFEITKPHRVFFLFVRIQDKRSFCTGILSSE